MKQCTKCKQIKLLSEFTKHKRYKDGLEYICKICKREYDNKTRNKEKDRIRAKEHYYLNREKKLKYAKFYREIHKKERNEYQRKRTKEDIYFRLKNNLTKRLCCALKRNFKKGSAVRDLGCSIEEFKVYIESKFKEGMAWDNYGITGWHIDHIIPLNSFDLTNKEQLLKALHYTNLQPLWYNENISKGDKINGKSKRSSK